MSSRKAPVQAFIVLGTIGLFALSLLGPPQAGAELSILMEPDGTGAWRDLIDDFQKQHPEIRVRLVEGPAPTDTREDMYSVSFLSGDSAYDIVYCDVVWVPKFAAAGWLLDLTDRVAALDSSDFLPADLQAGTYRGRLYRLPVFTDAGVLYYRKDLVHVAPETFNDLRRLSEQFQTTNRWGFLWQGKQYEGLVTVFLEVLWGFGGDWIDSETREVRLDEPEAVRAVEFLKGSIGSISPAAVTTYAEEDTRTLFQNGRSVFLRNWPYVWTVMSQTSLGKEDRVGMTTVAHAPEQRSAATLGGWGFGISRFTRRPEVAWEFLRFITAPDQLRKIQLRMGRIPARRSLVPAEFVPILESARARPAIPEYAQASDILQRWLSAALTDRADPAEALRRAAQETRLLLGVTR